MGTRRYVRVLLTVLLVLVPALVGVLAGPGAVDQAAAEPFYTLTYTAGPGGTISGTTPQTVDSGASGTEVTAVANTGYQFVSWSDGVLTAARTDTGGPVDLNVTANFAPNQYTLTYNAGLGGTISGDTSQTVEYLASGTPVTAVANTGYHFVSWSDGVLTAARTDVAGAANLNVTANFAIDQVVLSVTTVGEGSVARAPNQTTYDYGTPVELTATPAVGWQFAGWSGDASGSANPLTVTMTGDKAVTATFTGITYTIMASAGPNGTITPLGLQVVPYGGSQSFIITAADGYHVADVIVDGASVGPVTSYPFGNVTADHSISATFAIDTFTITPSAAPNGFISPSSPQTVPYGGSQSFTITPANGYHVANVIVDGASIGPVTSHTFTSVTDNHSISATFAVNTYTITPIAGPNGFISPPTPQTVEYGQKQAFTIRAAAGYYVDDVVVDGASVGPVTAYTFTGVNASHTISASFAPGVQTGLWISTSKTVVNYGSSALLQGELYDASDQLAPVGLGGRPVTFEYSSSPTGPWASLGTHLTSSVAGALGKVSVTISPQAPTYYRLRYYKEASLEYGGAVSEVRKVGVRPSLGRPVVPTSAKVNRWFTVYGSLKPHFAAGQKTVEIKVYRYRNGRWVKVKTQWATNVDSRDFTKYRLRTRLTTKAKYRFRATSTAAGWVAVTTSYSKTLVVR